MTFPKYKERGAYHYQWYKDNTFGYRDLVDSVVDFCQGSTLDVGCGEGVVVKLLADNGCRAEGIDNEPEAINLAKNSVYGWCRVQDINYPMADTWSYLSCLNVIEHLERPERIVEIFRDNITKAGIIITDAKQPTLGKYHTHEFTKEELLDLFKDYKPEYFEPAEGFIGVKIYK